MYSPILVTRQAPENQINHSPTQKNQPYSTPSLHILRTTATPPSIPAKNHSRATLRPPPLLFSSKLIRAKPLPSLLRANPPQKYIYPDPNPEFSETKKFREELVKKLSKEKGTFGNELDAVVNICTEIFSEFLHTEYGGPGTLLVEPFTDMMVSLKEKKLPGAPLAARAPMLWAQNFVDRDWEIWNSTPAK